VAHLARRQMEEVARRHQTAVVAPRPRPAVEEAGEAGSLQSSLQALAEAFVVSAGERGSS
jgi:hypothetical protein